MPNKDLEKSAEKNGSASIPKEVLRPHKTARLYTFHTHQPSASLAPFVDYYWIMRWDLAGRPPYIAEVIPSPYTNLTFMPEGARITGVTTGKYAYELKGRGAIVGVKFKPGGLHPFLKSNLHALTDIFMPAIRFFPEVDEAYNDAMLSVSDERAVSLVEELLQSKSPKADKYLALVTDTLDYLAITDRPLLSAVVERSGLSERRLQEIFRECVGVGVKWIILRARLIKAVELAATLESPNWTDIAHDLGYGDQSHFINDFKRIIGKTPTQYTAEVNESS